MTKKYELVADAERFYVVEEMTIEEIAAKLKVNEKTIRFWKSEGNWETKKSQYIKAQQMFHEDLYNFARKLMSTIEDSFEKGEKVDPGRMFTFMRMLPMITKIKEYEDIVAKCKVKTKAEAKKGLSKFIINQIESEILGMDPNEAQ